jgi:hypothetical protein
VQQLSAQEVIVKAMIANAGTRVRNDFFMVLFVLVSDASIETIVEQWVSNST